MLYVLDAFFIHFLFRIFSQLWSQDGQSIYTWDWYFMIISWTINFQGKPSSTLNYTKYTLVRTHRSVGQGDSLKIRHLLVRGSLRMSKQKQWKLSLCCCNCYSWGGCNSEYTERESSLKLLWFWFQPGNCFQSRFRNTAYQLYWGRGQVHLSPTFNIICKQQERKNKKE